jgi:hypothetical protein
LEDWHVNGWRIPNIKPGAHGPGGKGGGDLLPYLCLDNMLICVRTKIDIQDDLLVQLKLVAAESNRSLKELVEDAIRAALALRQHAGSSAESRQVVTFRGNGVQGGINLNSTSELLDVMDGTR